MLSLIMFTIIDEDDIAMIMFIIIVEYIAML